MADKAKFAFGSLAGLQDAIDSGRVDAFDMLCLIDDGVARVGWVDKNGVPQIVSIPEDDVLVVDELPETGKTGVIYIVGEIVYVWNGEKFIVISESTDLTDVKERLVALEEKASSLEELVEAMGEKVDADEVDAKYLSRKYEITDTPKGTLVDYREKEIRVMCPENTQWVKQNVGATGNANMYYMGFKAYAPEGAVSFKEDDMATLEDQTMYYFEGNDFAGTDEHGRKYSIVWLALASYDEASDTWSYFGKNSSVEKYIGWDYVVEWYDANGIIIESDHIRINLSNEECHSVIEPYYLANIEKEMKAYTDAKIEEIIEIPVIEF